MAVDELLTVCSVSFVLIVLSTTNVLTLKENSCRNQAVHAKNCCQLPGIVNQSVVHFCDSKFPHNASSQRGTKKKEGSCVVECMYEKIGAFRNRTLNLGVALEHIWQTAGRDPNFGPLLNETVPWCHRNTTENAILFKREGCSFIPQEFNDCVKRMLFVRCPSANWTSKPECDDLKHKIEEGCSYSSLY